MARTTAVYNIPEVMEGTYYTLLLYLKEESGAVKNILGWDGRAYIKSEPGGTKLGEFYISVSATYGSVLMRLSETETRSIAAAVREDLDLEDSVTSKTLAYDLMLDNGSHWFSYLRGTLNLIFSITDTD